MILAIRATASLTQPAAARTSCGDRRGLGFAAHEGERTINYSSPRGPGLTLSYTRKGAIDDLWPGPHFSQDDADALKSILDSLKKPAAPITIPTRVSRPDCYHTWFEADLSRPYVDSMKLNEAERDTWQIPELVCHSAGAVVGGVGSHLLTGVVPLPLNTGSAPPRRGP